MKNLIKITWVERYTAHVLTDNKLEDIEYLVSRDDINALFEGDPINYYKETEIEEVKKEGDYPDDVSVYRDRGFYPDKM